jgi:putative DNA primase/helicase
MRELLRLSRDLLLNDGVSLPDLATPEGRAFLDAVIERENAEVIVLDSLSTLIRSGVENEAESWVPVQDWLLRHRFHGRTVVLVHHDNKTGQARGSSKREDVLDTVIQLQESDEAEAHESVFKLRFTKSREFAGSDKASLTLRLTLQSGSAEWSYEQHDDPREQVVQLVQGGMKQAQVAKQFGLTPGRVSQIVKENLLKQQAQRRHEDEADAVDSLPTSPRQATRRHV